MPKAMEDIWKEITLTDDHTTTFQGAANDDQPSSKLDLQYPNTTTGIFFQDLLSTNSSSQSHKNINPTTSTTNEITTTTTTTTVAFSLFPSTPPHIQSRSSTTDADQYLNLIINPAPSPKSHIHDQCKKQLMTPEFKDDLNHRRHRRMIKNREAASRSRARRQAYTEGLELNVAHLMKENAKLRKELQQSHRCLETSSEPPTKSKLYRTSTAPF